MDSACSQRGDPRERPSVENEHAADKPIAKIELALVQKPPENREPSLVLKRLAGWHAVVPRDLERADNPRALKPRQEQPHPPANERPGRDPLVDEILPKIAQLEVLRVEPEHKLDRFGHERPRVLHRCVSDLIAAMTALRELRATSQVA